jgi:4-aminobutyrate aminotransferase-like enzyme
VLARARSGGREVAAFFCESMLGCAGQIVPPEGFLRSAFDQARDDGVITIADEVQVGFGRVGSHFWAFEMHDARPDIVTLGKPIGNGHPLAAVITTPELAEAFDNGMEYFNTFGGNPVSCAIGMAVLDVIEEEGLQQHARAVGALLTAGLEELGARHEIVGDVRGRGLFLGLELVRDRATLEPAADEAGELIEAMKDRCVLLSTDGPLHNVIKIKPPLAFGAADADRLVVELDGVLGEDAVRGEAP